MRIVLVAFLSLFTAAALGGNVTDIGDTTSEVLAKQRQGEGAVEHRPELGDVAERTYERYLESFTHPIPDQYERGEGFGSSN